MLVRLFEPFVHLFEKHCRFFKPSHRLPEQIFDGLGDAGQKCARCERVPGVATSPRKLSLSDFDEAAVALRAGKRGKFAPVHDSPPEGVIAHRNLDFERRLLEVF